MEPFKEFLNADVVRQLGQIFARVYTEFDEESFLDNALEGLGELELKERARHIMDALDRLLPQELSALGDVVLASLHPSEDPSTDKAEFGPEGVMGFAAWAVTDLVTHRGIEKPEHALPLLKEVTKRFSAEFAIRPFLDQHTDQTLKVLEGWVTDNNRHVRRLVSEGTRPRLPWGMRLNKFVTDPSRILPFLEALKDDGEEYVRRSVANNLNDIAKDHPDLVADIATSWLKDAGRDRQRMVKHACRTLIKQGHERTLAAFGYKPVAGIGCVLALKTPVVNYGEMLVFETEFKAPNGNHNVMVDYAIHFVKANGRTAPKVFKWKDTSLSGGKLAAIRKHAIKPITTRTYYAGTHELEIFVNGISVAKAPFELVI